MSKRALIVGINHFAPRDPRSDIPDLRGCVNDARLMRRHLVRDFDFPAEQIRVLIDAEATGREVRKGLDWLFSGYDGDGSDVRLFHISTHGTQVRVESEGDERDDDLDEAFVVHDHEWGEPFRDNEIRSIFATVPENVSVVFQADCCHSGDIAFSMFQPMSFAATAEEELGGLSGADTLEKLRALRKRQQRDAAEIDSRPSVGLEPDPADIVDPADAQPRRVLNPDVFSVVDDQKQRDFRIVESESRHVLVSACEDIQESKEFLTGDGYHGGLTWAVSRAIEETKKESRGDLAGLTYRKLIETVGDRLRFSRQTPLLECREDLLDRPVYSPVDVGTKIEIRPPVQGEPATMSEPDKTTSDQLMLFLMAYVANPKEYKSRKARLELMKKCQLHPELRDAMKTGELDMIAQALSEFAKPIGDEGGGRPIGDEGGRT